MLGKALLQWVAGIIAVAAAIWVAKLIGLKLEWHPTWRIVLFVPVLAIANAVVAPVLRLVSMPISCITFGLFGFVINAVVFWIAGALTGAEMSLASPLVGSIVVSLVGSVLNSAIKEHRK